DQALGKMVLPDLKTVFQKRGISILQHFGKYSRFLAEALQRKLRKICRSDNLRAICLYFPIANTYLAYAIHEFGYQIKMKASRTKSLDPALRRQDYPGVLNG